MSATTSTARIAIIGIGAVGSTIAYTLLHGSLYSELLIVDVDPDKRDAQVRDLSDAAFVQGTSTRVRSATIREAGGCDVVVIAAGVKRRRGETKIQHLERTTAILRRIVGGIKPFLLPSTILLIVSISGDILTTLAHRLAGLPSSQVLGLGTYLDTVRLRRMMGDELKIPRETIHADVIGTQDDGAEAEFPAWSTAVISGVPLSESTTVLPGFTPATVTEMVAKCTREGHLVINTKGAPTFGIASSVARITCAIIFDNKAPVPLFGRLPHRVWGLPLGPMPISHFQENLGCCLSLPALLGRKGVSRTVDVKLEEREERKLIRAGVSVGEMVERLMADGTENGVKE